MAELTTLSQLLQEAPDFIKLIEDGVVVFSDAKSKGLLAGFADLEKFAPDILKVYNGIKAIGAAQVLAQPGTSVGGEPQ